MIIEQTTLPGAIVMVGEAVADERGHFATTWDQQQLARSGLEAAFVCGGIAHNRASGTLRGFHYQAAPHAQVKLVSCIRGAAFDVIADLRDDSPTYLRWYGVTLEAHDLRTLYVPRGFAHGYQTLVADTVLSYQLSSVRLPDAERGVRWDDPALAVSWPLIPTVISPRDRAFPLLKEASAR